MRNTGFAIIVPPLFSPQSAFSAESRSYNITLRFNLHETLQYFKLSRVLIVLLIFFSIPSINASGNDVMDNTSFVIHVDDNLLTAKVRDMPLEKVLTEVADQMFMRIIYLVSGEEPVTIDFSRLPIEKGLKQLLRDYNYALAYDSVDAENSKSHIRKVFILSKKSDPKVFPVKFTPGFAGEASLEILKKALEDEDSFIREDAVGAIGALKDESTIELLKGVLLTDEDEYVRERAVTALGLMKSDDIIEPLMVALQDEDGEVRESAIDALAWIGGARANMTYVKALAGEEEKRIVEDEEIIETFKNKY